MNNGKKLVDELCNIVTSFLCSPGTVIDWQKCPIGPHVFAKGGTQSICTVKLAHGQTYNLEFVYRFWAHKLTTLNYPFSPFFIISHNGLSTTLKCFICEPRDIESQFGHRLGMDSDVYLHKNSSVVISQDDFVKFKTNLVFSKDIDIFNSMVVCRTYLTEHRQTLQFLVVKPKNPRRVFGILDTIVETVSATTPNSFKTDNMVRRPIRSPVNLRKDSLDEETGSPEPTISKTEPISKNLFSHQWSVLGSLLNHGKTFIWFFMVLIVMMVIIFYRR